MRMPAPLAGPASSAVGSHDAPSSGDDGGTLTAANGESGGKEMTICRKHTRREVLRRAAAAGAGLAGPLVLRSSALGKAGTVAPSERLTLGLMGCGEHGTNWNLP